VLAGPERQLDGGSERGLLGPRLERGQGGGEGAAGTEGVVHLGAKATDANGCSRGYSRALTKMSARCEFPLA
jgi:hypothetical protein